MILLEARFHDGRLIAAFSHDYAASQLRHDILRHAAFADRPPLLRSFTNSRWLPPSFQPAIAGIPI
jgi:hypothetical protein